MKTITVVIPAYNEQDKIIDTIRTIKQINYINKIIVVNDGSTDKTSELAKNENVEVIDLYPNRGKGGALNAVMPLIDSDIVVFLDADLGKTAYEAHKIIEPVNKGIADLCIAAFPPPTKKGGFGLVKGTAAWIIKKVGDIEVKAPLSGQRAMTIDVFNSVVPFNEGYGVELGMSIRALLNGYKLIEVPTLMKHNETGRDLNGFRHRGRQFIDVIKVINHEIRRKRL
ncbi:Glycosyltransferases involved in cell wall biogenesis [Candidatus Syntrophocurvum alkaliphilum]|uniref:Glucosyl-3-phosphoglycerate synthase n=1 Tax=Candidatus Syntrophocurvum alkaliphilum TaxID=2293317 RepID=A0A6I6DH73_9FIRM|nr:glycosyltransferase family 2 protein [Candidatus Syntrophocurvum alkaliphilum]QGT98979.1 Glycosyltransferases involved in cell wall biogenesis [Candidatus Syntrophocurvum alkaliphilum]